ncbi:flagellar basal body-associated FliL family protein [Jiella sp. MQZ9-1]|uniref:Flagellar protein FliL n=1 Tax=Jiella flava TaxID=2816857 RepID=A0A939FX09_9HYPH|nr:flagellar basal body-associated FliL family protein [Jiella flava]MBO0660944.1 flagellar basal body-associated FliL family protein [Jiella flava]MCD2469592.1 flagellar basal body-associated FliL family protein [Jiella flava]
MSEIDLPELEDGNKKGGMMPTILAVVVVTLVAAGGGAGLGMMLASSTPPPAAAEPAADPKAGDHAAEAADKSDIADAEKGKTPLQLIELKPVLTNIYAPDDAWLRIEASIVLKKDDKVNADVLAAEIEADTLAFLRSVQLSQIEGSRGLLHLRDDLRERAKLRSPDVVDYLIRTMVAE